MSQNKVAIISKKASNFIPLQEKLKENCLDICIVSSIDNLLDKYISLPFVLTIIDANSYGEETLKLVKHLRGAKLVPILVLMPELYSGNRLKLFQIGATVCTDAKTALEEQAAQAKALIQIYDARDDSLHRETLVYRGASLVINPIYRLVILDGDRIELSRREFDLLYFMAKHEMQVFTPEQLYRQLWSDEKDIQIGDTVKSCIKVLRKKLEPSGHDYIQNVRGIGYQFVGNTENG